jgi:hypothetical protein
MSNHKNLIFFNKEGDYLNFGYNDNLERFEGDILFHESSSDTYKTYGLYTFEKVPSFEYELPGLLTTKKFQLFNEFGIHFYGSLFKSQDIKKIEPVNNDPNFFSKWIYGDDFESKFPIGTIVSFDSSFLEFTNPDKTYVVVGVKKGAIMIIGQIDNSTFESSYQSIYLDVNSYFNIKVSGINTIGIYDYLDLNVLDNNLSAWNETNFYEKYFIGKKLNIVNSNKNDGTVTVNNVDLFDINHYEYYLDSSNLLNGDNLIIEVITKTDLPRIYDGQMTVNNNSTININPILYPTILKPGREFKIIGSQLNDIFFTVGSIPNWEGIVNETYFATQSQVLFNNKIYQCVLAYTQSFGVQSTSFVTPEDTTYWSPNPTYISVEQSTNSEIISIGQLYLTTDRYYFSYDWDISSSVTLASAAQKYQQDLSIFNIDIYYSDDRLKADLVYPTEYAVVNFYANQVDNSSIIGSVNQTIEKLVGVSENLNYELNYDISQNYLYNIVFTDIDEYGIKIFINGMVYEEEISPVYTGMVVDMVRTIDKTLRNWLSRNYVRLYTLGIYAELQFIGNLSSIFYNSIRIRTEYPNVPINLEQVLVGTTADFYIEHSNVLFTDLGPYLNININGIDYGVSSIYIGNTNITDIPGTLKRWLDDYMSTLSEFKIVVSSINNLLKFEIKDLNRRLDYTITTGKLNIPGLQDYIINKRIRGNHGALIASNEVILPKGIATFSGQNVPFISSNSNFGFEQVGFATGMVFSINNTIWPWVNQEFNIQYLDNEIMNISYQGPFWGLTDSICNSSAFLTLAFNSGFGQTGCDVPIVPIPGSIGGPFDTTMFSSAFSIQYNPNDYILNKYNLNLFDGTLNMVDILYLQLSNSIYALGDGLVVINASTGQYIKTIDLPNNNGSLKIKFNDFNGYLYCLSRNRIYVIDPLIDTLIHTISISGDGYDIDVNPINGDVYVTYDNIPQIDIWSYNGFNNPVAIINGTSTNWDNNITRLGKITFNSIQSDVYVTTDSSVLRINSNRTIQTSYFISGLIYSTIFYSISDGSILVYGSTQMKKIELNGNIQTLDINTGSFIDILFNPISNNISISDSSTLYTRLDTTNNDILKNSISNFGYLAFNQYDGDIYLSSQSLGSILVINPNTGGVIHTESVFPQTTKIIFNPERNSVWAIQPTEDSLIEVEVTVNSVIIPQPIFPAVVDDNLYGTLDPNYQPRPSIWLKTKDYIRRPRENFEGDVRVEYYWKWLTDDKPEFFMYDFSGDQLPTIGPYSYIGPKPLTEVVLNNKPNRDINRVSIPQYQQTIFDKITHVLPYIDDSVDNTSEVEPLQLFLGFKSVNEGAFNSTLQFFKKENITFDIISDQSTNITLEMVDNSNDRYGLITINENSGEYFTSRGLKPGQLIVIYLKDITNNSNQYISDNTASIFKIRSVFSKSIILDFLTPTDFLINENTVINDYPSVGNTTYLKFTVKVADKEIARFNTLGQTEDEDERFKIELGNIGKLISPDEVFIFKSYDILEGGIDWTILNKKRKEMLMMKHLIYPYIGAYKSIINAINYFGYNDLQLNEYYRNIDNESENFFKLFKVEIPDIFDNSVEGWEENDFIKNTYPNDNFEETNMFNLTYFITDKSGNSVLNYSLDEIIIKLQGLKYWLKRNIIPLTHKILDITGQAYFLSGNYILHKLHDTRIINIKQNMSPISVKMNESYLMPVNSGSTVYNCVIDFYSIIPGFGKDDDFLFQQPKPYNGFELTLPDTFDIKIRTYKTYKEWEPFRTYSKGDKVKYFDYLYESQIDNNKTKNPRKYELSTQWSANINYQSTSIVEYNRDFFVYSGLGSTQSSTPPILDAQNWLKVTEWKVIDFEPVQTIKEFRKGDNLLPFNFTIDSNIDPFITIEVTSDNGYGEIYRDRKNYELRGINDLGLTSVNQMGDLPKITTNLI